MYDITETGTLDIGIKIDSILYKKECDMYSNVLYDTNSQFYKCNSVFDKLSFEEVRIQLNKYKSNVVKNTINFTISKNVEFVDITQDGTFLYPYLPDMTFITMKLNLYDYLIILTTVPHSTKLYNVNFGLNNKLIQNGYKYTDVFSNDTYKIYKVYLN